MLVELPQTLDGFFPQRRGISSDVGLTRLFDAAYSPVQGRDELVELTLEIGYVYRHGEAPKRWRPRRETFHTSPHFAQRQYAFTSGLFAVVVIDEERQAGHADGAVTGPSELDADPELPRESNVIRLSFDLPHNFSFVGLK